MAQTYLHISAPSYQVTNQFTGNLYDDSPPTNTGYLRVSDTHQIWFEEYGNPNGIPVVLVHGGPGGAISPFERRCFDPEIYHIIAFDQRGAGKSVPAAEMKDNTPQHSIDDMETLRKHLGIDKWLIVGGSWGSCLSLLYGEAHPDRCLGFILRGIYLGTQEEYEQLWYGMGDTYPEEHQKLLDYLPASETQDLISAYHKRLMDPNPDVHMPAARAFSEYDMMCATLVNKSIVSTYMGNDTFVLSLARAFTHYSKNKFFLKPGQVLANLNKIKHLPLTIVHGRYDIITRPQAAYKLHTNWPESKLVFVQDAGHAFIEPGNAREIRQAADEFKAALSPKPLRKSA